MMTHDEMIAVIQAHKEGKQIQFRVDIDRWVDCPSNQLLWGFHNTTYRVKPEPPKPREWWLNTYPDRPPCVHDSKLDAEKAAGEYCIDCVLVREVKP